MERVTLRKNELIETIRKNRKTHEELYKEALQGYYEQRDEALALLSVKCKKHDDKEDKDVDFHSLYRLLRPANHTREYDRVIKMLEHHVADEVELSNEDFGRYFEDEWDWKQNWILSNSGYTKSINIQHH